MKLAIVKCGKSLH